jgi:hypothetical protein
MNEFFEEFGATLAAAARERGAEIQTPMLDPKLAQELLEMARVVAHTRERRFAPLSTFLAGVAAARATAAKPSLDDAAILDMIESVRARYEPQEDSPKASG